MLHQQRDVLPPLAQRGKLNGDHVQPVVQVLPKPSGGDLFRQIARGSGDQAHFHPGRLHPAHAFELALLDGAQELHLHLDRDLPDLVEEQRAAIGQLEAAGLALHGAGERPFFESEQLGLDQLARDRCAIDLDERPVAAAGLFVQRGCDQLLARAALALDQHRGGRVRHLGDDLLQLDHPLALADDLGEPPPWLVGNDVPGVQVGLARGLGDDRLQLGMLERLGDEVEGAGLHRLDGAVHAAVRRDHDHRYVRVGDHHLAQQRQSIHPWHHQIGDHHVGAVAVERRQCFLAVRCDLDLVTLALQRGREDLAEALFIVDDENPVGHLRPGGLSRCIGPVQTNRNQPWVRALVTFRRAEDR